MAANDGPAVDIDWDRSLRAALAGRGVHVHLQPIVDLRRLEVVGYEALARFDGPLGRRPDLWFEAARIAGAAAELDAVVVQRALGLASELPAGRFLTVNLEPESVGSPALDRVLGGRPLDGVVLELTEHAPVESYGRLLPVLDRYRAAGALIAIDDAGAGYAGLQHILSIRPAFLKLDRALVEGVDDDGAKAALIDMLGTFTDNIDAWIIAEGVETEAEARTLIDLGVPLGQGYLFARPADGCADADPSTVEHLRTYRHQCTTEPLRPLLQEVPCVRDQDGLPVHELIAGGDGAGRVTVVLDHRGRPLGTLRSPEDVSTGHLEPTLRVSLTTSPVELAQRIATLPAEEQHLPVVCCDDTGQFVGIVSPSRLMRYLAAQAAVNAEEHGAR